MKLQKKQVNIFLIALLISIVKEGMALPEAASETSLKPEYKAKDLRDPFQFFKMKIEEKPKEQVTEEEKAEAVSLPGLTIQGIVWGGNFPQAIINNKVVKIGDTVEGAQIIDIKKDGVTVYFGNRKHNLPSPAAINLKSSQKKPDAVKQK